MYTRFCSLSSMSCALLYSVCNGVCNSRSFSVWEIRSLFIYLCFFSLHRLCTRFTQNLAACTASAVQFHRKKYFLPRIRLEVFSFFPFYIVFNALIHCISDVETEKQCSQFNILAQYAICLSAITAASASIEIAK